MSKVVGIGETVLDIIFRNDRPDTATPGGSTFNAMISLGRTAGRDFPDVPVMMVTETGDDHIGDIVVSFMESNGVSTKAVTRNPGTHTHISLAFLNERNDADYEFYKDHQNASLQEDKLSNVHFSESDIVLFGSFFAVNPKIRRYTKTLLEEAAGISSARQVPGLSTCSRRDFTRFTVSRRWRPSPPSEPETASMQGSYMVLSRKD